MSITADEVRRVAALAHLDLDDAEVETFRSQLQAVLDHVAVIDALDLAESEDTASTGRRQATLRPDDVLPSLDANEARANAPDPVAGHFRVPRVLVP